MPKISRDEADALRESIEQYWPELGGQSGLQDRNIRVDRILNNYRSKIIPFTHPDRTSE